MSIRILSLLYLLSMVSNTVFAASDNTEKTVAKGLLLEAIMGEYRLLLVNDKPQCQLELQTSNTPTQLVPLALQSPCYFFPDNNKKQVQHYVYPHHAYSNDVALKVAVDPVKRIDVILIGGTAVQLSDTTMQQKKLPPNSYCTQQIQAITLENTNIKVGNISSNVFACAEDRLDEILYQQSLKQPRNDIETIIKQSQEKTALANDPTITVTTVTTTVTTTTEETESSFIENLQRKIQAIFK